MLAADGGLGKSRAVIDYVLKYVDLTIWRVLVFQPDHTRCDELANDFDRLKPENVPAAIVVQGRNLGLCEADKDIEEIAQAAETERLSARKVACPICPKREACAYLAQFERNGPGLYIAPHAYLKARTIPGFTRDDFAGQGKGAPILAVIIDEQFDPALAEREVDRAALVTPFEIPRGKRTQDESRYLEQRVRDVQHRLSGLCASAIGGRVTLEQIQHYGCDSFFVRDADGEIKEGAATMVFGELKGLLGDLHEDCVAAAADTAKIGRVSISKPLATARAQLQDIVDALTVIERGARATRRPFLHGLGVTEKTVELFWASGLPKHLFDVPLLALDGTMNEECAEQCFTYWCDFTASLVPPYYMKFTRIRSTQGAHTTTVKVLGAPVSKTKIRSIKDHVEYDDTGKHVLKRGRARRDADPERLIRVLWAIARRAESAGLVTHMALQGLHWRQAAKYLYRTLRCPARAQRLEQSRCSSRWRPAPSANSRFGAPSRSVVYVRCSRASNHSYG